ncbi:translation initiation factor 5B [Gorgonomyces haynaldii]|nr:translation initiation factor 5B [Gorgonomyces haynaldii]
MAKKKGKQQQQQAESEDDSKYDLNPEVNKDEEGQDLGGLMSAIQSRRGKKPKQKKKKFDDDDDDDAVAILARLDKQNKPEDDEDVPRPKAKSLFNALQMDDEPEEEEEPEPVIVPEPLKKKDKKNKKKDEEEEVEKVLEKTPDEPEFRIKSKKEKEREKKERQKQLKKQQAAQKPVETLDDIPDPVQPAEPEPVPEPAKEPVVQEQDDGKKKKKKKGPNLSALREALAAKKALEEEQKRLEELERQKEEEERLRAEEEERKKQEAKQKKKEKERLKKEELKKQGKYMTPAQKLAAQQAQQKLQALLASGSIKVEALAEKTDGKPKRVVYENKKKKKPQAAEPVKEVEKAQEEVPESWEEEPKESWDQESDKEVKQAWDQESDQEVKDSWDQESDQEVQDSWDQEEPAAKVVKPSEKPAPKTVQKSAEKPAQKQAEKPAQKQAAKAVEKTEEKPAEDEESEEEDSEEEESEEEDSEEESDEEMTQHEKDAFKRKEEARLRRLERQEEALKARSKENLRSPICVIMGHVDTGKTKLLDKIRQTNVQEGEAGGITQQIGATYFPLQAIVEKTQMMREQEEEHPYKLPGLLMIDTPGHESFSNLRSRGSSLCNMAVLVVDIVHGLEPQTIESLNMLRARKTPFIVALNKIDRLFDWETHKDYPSRKTLALQKKHVLKEFNDRLTQTIVQFAEQGLNACLYWENENMGRNVSLVPTSAHTGEGVPDLLHLLMDLTQTRMTERLMYLSEVECTVLEVKVIEGLGTTIDVVLSNGVLNEGDKIVVCGIDGPIVTQIRALLTPQPMRELRVKSAYVHHKSIKAAMGVKISAPDLEKAIAGSRLLVVGPDDDVEDLMDEVTGDLESLLTSVDKSGKGVCVQASTLGSLEALLSFLKDMKIPVSGINIGPVHKKDVIRASVMLERAPQYAQLLAFDVTVDKDAEDLAKDMGVTIFTANIIYHLFDKYTKYMKDLEEAKRKELTPQAIFPALLKMVPDAIFNKRNPIIIGVDVAEGILKVGTPLCVVSKDNGQIIPLGKVVGIELNHKQRNQVKRGDPAVAIRIEQAVYETPKAYGRHFTDKDEIYSLITRGSIDILKQNFRNDLSREEWQLVVKLKKILRID